jgi:hypothetical protein
MANAMQKTQTFEWSIGVTTSLQFLGRVRVDRVGQMIVFRRLPGPREGWQTTENDGLPHKVDSIGL